MESPDKPLDGSADLPLAPAAAKQPRSILHEPAPPEPGQTTAGATVFAFPPNRETLGGTAYLIVEEVNILVDCPSWNADNQSFLAAQGGVDWLVITHRGGMSNVRQMQQALNCRVAVQEQEAYLLPDPRLQAHITSFGAELALSVHSQMLWTPGHSPGSACLYFDRLGGVLFSGRHLLPDPQGRLGPLKTSKTFHWPRQLQSVQHLLARFTPETLQTVCPGGNIGFLRGRGRVANAYAELARGVSGDSNPV